MTTFLVLLAIVLAVALVITGVQSKQNAEKVQRCCNYSRQLEQDKLVLVSEVNKLSATNQKMQENADAQAVKITDTIGSLQVAKQNLKDLQVAYEATAKELDEYKKKEDNRKAMRAAQRARQKQKKTETLKSLKKEEQK